MTSSGWNIFVTEDLMSSKATIRMITDTICHHLDQSVRLAGDVASGYYEEFFPGGNKDKESTTHNIYHHIRREAVLL